MNEEAVVFGLANALVGVITDPSSDDSPPRSAAVILLNAGLLHRIGPNRLYVELARLLAAMGFVTLRFDLSGIGDSEARRDALSFAEGIVSDVGAAMDLLGRERRVDRFILMGLCAGAVSAFNVACADRRVVGTVLINPEGYDDEVSTAADARRYWSRAFRVLGNPSRWPTAIPRNLGLRELVASLRRLASAPPAADALRVEFEGLIQRGVAILVLFSSIHQRGVAELETILGGSLRVLLASRRLRIETIGQATHTFDQVRHQAQLLDVIARWTAETCPLATRHSAV